MRVADLLMEICDKKRAHVAERKLAVARGALVEKIEKQLLQGDVPRDFIGALRQKEQIGEFGIIAEIKKASPSAGLIRPDFDVANIARAYEAGGAACLSVLTDAPYFSGADENIPLTKSACAVPILRKDFMVDAYQVDEARALGADAILIIMAAVDDKMAHALDSRARELGMVSIFEVHDAQELDRTLSLPALPQIIGINHRNLKTLGINLDLSAELSARIPSSVLCVAESGLKTNTDLKKIKSTAGINSFLIGETLMRQEDITAALIEVRS